MQTALEEDADVIGISAHSWEYLYYTPELLDLLKQNDLDIPIFDSTEAHAAAAVEAAMAD